MKSRPIIMSGNSVRAILDGNKTMTRRPIKNPERLEGLMNYDEAEDWCPYGKIGDELWVRETYVIEDTYEYYNTNYPLPKDRPIKKIEDLENGDYYLIPHYRATEPEPHIVPEDREDEHDDTTRWRPSIFMPRWASRITLKITDIKVERLQDMTYKDGEREGIKLEWTLQNFHKYWDELYKNKPEFQWNANPWVWVIEFKKQGE